MGKRNDTEYKVVTIYDGEADAADAFADVILFKIREKRSGKCVENAEKVREKAYNGNEVQDYPDPASRLCG